MLEVQQTFYQPPATATMAKWRRSMPTGFEFTIKAWQLITHTFNSSTYRRLKRPLLESERPAVGGFQDTSIVQEAWETTLACARTLSATAIVFQCPASFKPLPKNIAQLRAFFTSMKRPQGVRLLWKPRDPWPEDTVAKLCNSLDLTHVVDPFVNPTVTRGFAYFRLHGTTGARHVYSDGELAQLVQRLPSEGETYVMFNNMPRVQDARRFMALVGVAPRRASLTA